MKLSDVAGRIPHQRLPVLVLVLALLWCLVSLLGLVFDLFRTPADAVAVLPGGTSVAQSSRPGRAVDPQRLAQWRLFGSAQVEAVPETVAPLLSAEEESAQETRLPLTLQGVMVARSEQRSRAVIAYKGAQDSYGIGQVLPAGNQIKLVRVLADMVLIDNRGELEKLLLFDDEPTSTRAPTSAARRTTAARPQAQQAPRGRTAAANNSPQAVVHPASMLGSTTLSRFNTLRRTIRMAPTRDDSNTVVGYRLSPGQDTEMFSRLGLREGDLVTHLNGVAVGGIQPDDVLDIVNQGDMAEITVQRGEQTQLMRLDLRG